MGYDRGDGFPFDFEPTWNPFGSKSKGKLSPRSYPIQYERKWRYSCLSAAVFDLDCMPWLKWLRVVSCGFVRELWATSSISAFWGWKASLPSVDLHTEESFGNLFKSNRNQIIFTIFQLIWNQTDTVRLLFQINWKMVNTILFRFVTKRFRLEPNGRPFGFKSIGKW